MLINERKLRSWPQSHIQTDLCIRRTMNFNVDDWRVSYKIDVAHPLPYLCTCLMCILKHLDGKSDV